MGMDATDAYRATRDRITALLRGVDPEVADRRVVRSCSDRRTLDQIAALDWGGADPTPWLPAFTWGAFTPPAAPFETPDAG